MYNIVINGKYFLKQGGQAMAVKINLAAAMKPKERILDIPVEMIVRNPNQPRKIFLYVMTKSEITI